MTILLKKCSAFGCDRTVSELAWALGRRACARHAKSESGTVSRRQLRRTGRPTEHNRELSGCVRPELVNRGRWRGLHALAAEHERLAETSGAGSRAE